MNVYGIMFRNKVRTDPVNTHVLEHSFPQGFRSDQNCLFSSMERNVLSESSRAASGGEICELVCVGVKYRLHCLHTP